jgi:polyhydroxyalkanoate synthesis repressor PhaR
MTIIIKRYPNRKLYDTTEKTYITLDRVADLIRQGIDVQVVDYATGEDLTAVTLTQILFEQEKKQSGFLPRPLLTGLVKAGGETLESVRRTLTKPLELIAHVDDEIERRIHVLIEKNELTEEDGERLRRLLISVGSPKHEVTVQFDRVIQKYLGDKGFPSRNDYENLLAKLDELTEKVEELSHDQENP